MTNGEKYLKDGVDIEKMAEEMVDLWNFPPYEGISPADIVDYFNMKTKPTLTEDERVKEMVYSKERKREMLATGYYFGLLYYVLNLGTHPTAYVKIPESHWLYNIDDYDAMPINCHGGLTFVGNVLRVGEQEVCEIKGKFIGWDYAHCDDYTPYYDDLPTTNLAEKATKYK